MHTFTHMQTNTRTYGHSGRQAGGRAWVGGRGTHTDSSANKAGLYVVRISLRTVSDVPAYVCGEDITEDAQ